jgi:hypothetical protein
MSQKEDKMKTLKLALAASLLAGTLALSAAPANAVIVRGAVATGGVHTGTAYWILACPAGVIASAMVKNWRRHKELTAQEAWTCGLLYWWNEGSGVYGR